MCCLHVNYLPGCVVCPSSFMVQSFSAHWFVLTQVWSQKEYPLIPVGKMVLNRNAVNYFAEIEQLAFDPSNMPPGIEASPDKMLQVKQRQSFLYSFFSLIVKTPGDVLRNCREKNVSAAIFNL